MNGYPINELYPFEHTSSCTCNISNLVFDIVLRT